MSDRCNGCGGKELPMRAYECIWPDGRTTIEQYCDNCRRSWHPQLIRLGAKLTPVDGRPEAESHLTLGSRPPGPPRGFKPS